MNIKDLSKPLPIENVEFRIQSINNGKFATILSYKDARVDMQRLDEVVGPLNWKREHTRDNKNCIVSIWDTDKKEWISKEDTGTESNNEKEKGLASDSFKRACFNWGIGRELYDYPVIKVKLFDAEVMETGNAKPKYRASYNFDLKKWSWALSFENGKPCLVAKDVNGIIRFDSKKISNQISPKLKDELPWLNKMNNGELNRNWNRAVATIKSKGDKEGLKALSQHFRISKQNRELLIKESK